ncbi:MAG TPA: phosphoglycerate dehydrogenase [Bacteroidia bacterium]|jgi:D-3-phosphoglycerate dehydrogenase|nr:phosphoglycerate dehydrogenase [Bacteroidia bacterium]HQK97186.1 phosphoglycerate dehydrogenase [Bacteroidia bacterium]
MRPTSFPKDKLKVLLLENVHPSAVKMFKNSGYSDIEIHSGSLSEKELMDKISKVHILGIRSKTLLTDNILKKAEKLLAVGAFCIGTNQIDMKSATREGIAVFNSPFSNTRSVAELVIGLSIILMRRITEKNEGAHKGLWLKESSGCFEVRGKTLGIIGYGHIGSQVSVLAESMGMKVIFYDVASKLSLGNATPCRSMDELLKNSDIVSLHVPGNNETKNLINYSRLKKMKKGAILINLSRGDVMDVKAVKEALISKQIGGLGVDVFPEEPQSNKDIFSSPLQNLPNVILTPHIGGSTMEAQEAIGLDVAEKLISFTETGSSNGSLTVPEISLPLLNNAHRILHIHHNVPGVLSQVNGVLSKMKVNILGQYLQTNREIGYVVLDIDKKSSSKAMGELKKVKNTIRTRDLY